MENNKFNFINIITPCTRPKNLLKISESINIPRDRYRWIVVFDSEKLPDENLIPENCEAHLFKDPKSVFGNAQRNYALDLIKDGYIYFNDDDTAIHKDFWENIKNLNNDFILFVQEHKTGRIRFNGRDMRVGQIDSHNFLLHNSLVGISRWELDKYDADGRFALECFAKAKNHILLDKVLSTYNLLR